MKDVTKPANRQARTPPSWRVRLCLSGMFFALLVCGVHAQEETAATIPGPELDAEQGLPQLLAIEALPEPVHLAAALSDRDSRNSTLLTLVAVDRMLDHATRGRASDAVALEARFLDERAWLDRLTLRFTGSPMRGSELDPSAWFVLRELSEHQLEPGVAVSPMGPSDDSLLRQLFDRDDERLSAAVLPEVLQRTELKAAALWTSLLESAAVNPPLHQVLSGIYADWFHRWVIADPPEPPDSADGDAIIAQALKRLRALTVSVAVDGPPDDQLLAQLRFDLLTTMPALDEVQSRDAGYVLELATAIDGLRDGHYLAFTEDLLSVVSELLLNAEVLTEPAAAEDAALEELLGEELANNPEETVEIVTETEAPAAEPEAHSVVPEFLFEVLPGLSGVFSGSFSEIDPRINASLAAVFDVVQYLQNNPGPQDPARLAAMRENIGDSIAQIVLQIPDMGYYFDQPVRQRIANEIDVCISIAAGSGQSDAAGFSREQFDGCLKSLVEMSRDLVSKEELSGDSFGPFGSEQLRRELMMTPWQRINYTLGYLHDRFPTGCELPAQPLPNPLEWSGLATVITWFARQAPVYFQTPENETLLLAMRQQGLDLLRSMAQQVDCISGQGMGIKDPVRRSLANYRLALDDLVAGIHQAELDFRARRLKPGADVALHGDATQVTAYRTDGLVIGPCDPQAVCEMTGELEATRALVGLFPDPYLIADQTGLGKVEICYQNVDWVDRRAVPVRPEDPSVANYFGHLSFELVGRYHEKGAVSDVFGSTIVSPDEYHYLFAAATDEVRDDSCPVEWVGTRIVTTLDSPGPIQVVPDRLTYLASARKKPSEVIEANWSRGAEWRDWFVTGLGVTPHEYPTDASIDGRVNQHLRNLYQIQQSTIYAALLRPQTSDAEGEAMGSLLDLQVELTARKALVRAYLNLFYPDSMMEADAIRGALEGYGSLLDTSTLLRFRESRVAVSSINEAGISRIEAFQADWNRQPESVRRTGSVSISVAHAIIRLNALYFEFFVLPTENRESRSDVMSPF